MWKNCHLAIYLAWVFSVSNCDVYFYVLVSLKLIAEEIEDPFSGDDNDLPTKKMAANIKKHVEELL